jgi:cell division septum initiation protein DivIVA
VSEETIQWQPIGALPAIGSMIDEWLAEVKEQCATLDVCRSKPHVLDDDTLVRVTKVYSAQAGDIRLFEEQLLRWKSESLTPEQGQELGRLEAQIATIGERIAAILALAEELKNGTIERVLEKSDLELGIEALLGNRKL